MEQGALTMFQDLKKNRGIMFYTFDANSEQELDQKVKQLDNIMVDNKAEYLGPEISDGNIAR